MKNQNKPVKKLQLQKLKIASLSTKQMRRIYGGVTLGTGTFNTDPIMLSNPQGPPIKLYTKSQVACGSGVNGCGTQTCNC